MRIFLRIAAIFYLVYLAIALLLISPLLNFLPQWYMQDTYHRQLQTGWVLLNPFKLSLDISEAQLSDITGERFVAFKEASVNLSLESLWRSGWILDELKIQDLYVAVTRLSEDEFNFSDLLTDDGADATTPAPPENDVGQIPGATIHDLDVHSEAIVLTDQARESAYTTRFNGLHIQVTELSTVFEEGRPFTVDVEAESGGRLHWEGEVSVPQGHSAGRLSLSNLNLHHLWLFAKPWLEFELSDGRLTVTANYELNWKDTLDYRISDGHISFSGLDIAPKSPQDLPDTAVGLKALDIDNIALDSRSQRVTIDSVTLDDLALATWLEDSAVSLQRMFVAPAAEEPAAEENSGDSGWSVALNKAQLRNAGLRWRSQFTDPQSLDIRPIDATIEHLTWPLSGETTLSLNVTANEQAHITVNGKLALEPGDGSIDYALYGLPLTWLNPNLPTALKATITDGQVEVKGSVALQEYTPATIALDGKIREFSARQEDTETTLTGFDELRINGLAVDMNEHSLVLKKVTLDTYTGRVHINKDGSINAANIWKEEVGDQAQQIAEDLTENKPWTFSIPTILISASQIDFMDQSLPIVFRTVIGDLEGEVLNIDSESSTAASVDLKGSVDGYAPVALNGKVAPFAAPPDLDLNLTFDGVDMAQLSPYSGTYAGYAIDRGLLDLHLHYALKDNHLQGDNSIRIEKLKLGEKIVSDKAVDLPLELALAILTDANGVIDMAVPVKGDVNNPNFELGSVISRAIINLIRRAITAPFSLLANLVNTEEDLQHLTFSSGSATLNDKNQKKLAELAAALTQRPKLSLVITGRLNKTADRERLQRNALKVLLLEQGLSAEEIKARGPDWEEAITERYEALPGGTENPVEPTPSEQYTKVWQSIQVSDEQMTALAGERAVAVKRYLVTTEGLAPERAVVGQSNLKDSDNEYSGVELGIGDN